MQEIGTKNLHIPYNKFEFKIPKVLKSTIMCPAKKRIIFENINPKQAPFKVTGIAII